MKHETAKLIIDLLLRHSSEQDQLVATISREGDEDELDQARKIIAATMGSLFLDGLRPLFVEHPDLCPDELGDCIKPK